MRGTREQQLAHQESYKPLLWPRFDWEGQESSPDKLVENLTLWPDFQRNCDQNRGDGRRRGGD